MDATSVGSALHEGVAAELGFIPPSQAGSGLHRVDLRTRAYGLGRLEWSEVAVASARGVSGLGIDSSGFALLQSPSAVTDFYDCGNVMATYYAECKATARELTGARTTCTFDHIIREPGLQYSGGGIDRTQRRSGVERGGGYIGGVHMDYTDNTTWDRYLALHGERVPEDAEGACVLNFWRPLSTTADNHPLAVCDARTVRAEDLQESVIYGYGAENYSWHDIGIETFSVAHSHRHRWYYVPGMTPDEVLVIKSFDSEGVIGRACPHASFAHSNPNGEPRRSIELRVLCFL